MKDVVDAIYTRLGSSTGSGSFHALLGGRYYHVEAPQNIEFPHCVYALDPVDNANQFDGTRILTAAITFDIYCVARLGAAAAMDIEEALFFLLDQRELAGVGVNYGGVSLQCLVRGVPSVTDEFIVITTTYSIFTTRIA
jgi:hypothetical protein